MSSSGLCACGGDRKPIGKCVRCGCPVCERCVGFMGGKAVCKMCATGHEVTIALESRGRGRHADAAMADGISSESDIVLKRRHQIRKVIQTLRKCWETALLIITVSGVILFLVFFSHIMDFFAFYAIQVENPKNPLAKLTIQMAARTDMLYMRYSPAIGLYTIYMDKYPGGRDIPVYWYRIGMSCYYLREYKVARYYLIEFCSRWPNHELKKEAFDKVSTIDGILAVLEATADDGKPPDKKPRPPPREQ